MPSTAADQAHRRATWAKYRIPRALSDLYKSKPCLDCGGKFPPQVMEYDHRDASMKVVVGGRRRHVSWIVKDGGDLQVLLSEIDKCDLLCANCHRLRTIDRLVPA